MEKITEGISILQRYAIYKLSGTVESETSRSETEVSGHIPSNNSNIGGRISSSTTQYQTIYLKDDGGKESVVELIDFVVPCREGHRLTIWGVNKSSWFSCKNHTTEQSYSSKKPLIYFTMPKKAMNYSIVGIFIFLFIFLPKVLNSGSPIFMGIFGGLFCLFFITLFLIMPAGKVVSMIRVHKIFSAKKQFEG